jgi:hypothetical protein
MHLCGDQHLAVVVKHGIEKESDGPYGFTNPAIVNTIYGRWWHPLDEKPGPGPVPDSPLPWTGEYLDGLGNKIRMIAYANPEKIADETQRADGFGLIRFDKKAGTAVLECWPRFAKVADGDKAQFPGWPMTVKLDDNDGRAPAGYLPKLDFGQVNNPVVEVIREETGESLYVRRIQGSQWLPPVFEPGAYTVKAGRDKPDAVEKKGLPSSSGPNPETLEVGIP